MAPDRKSPDDIGTKRADDLVGTERTRTTEACLVVLYGLELGKRYKVNRPQLIIGRSSKADIQIDQEAISRNHCKVINTGHAVMLRDMGSTNGTYIDGAMIDECVLRDGDQIKVGRCIFKFLSGDNVESSYHEEMLRLTMVDALTALVNRSHFRKLLDAAAPPLAVILLDLDLFKELNENHGHLAGDHVLSVIGERLRAVVDPRHTVARYGGDEFAVSTDLDLAAAHHLAEAIVTAVAATPIAHEIASMTVTISAGVADAAQGEAPAAVLARAEALLARAKLEGRNRAISSRELRKVPASPPRRHLEIRPGDAVASIGLVGRNLIASQDRGAAMIEDIEAVLGHLIAPIAYGRTQAGGPLLVVASKPDTLEALEDAVGPRLAASLAEYGLPYAPVVFGPIAIATAEVGVAITTAVAGLVKQLAEAERSTLPAPIAHAVSVMEARTDAAGVAMALVALHESLLRWVFACAAAELATVADALSELPAMLAKPSTTGSWMGLLRKALAALGTREPVHAVWSDLADPKRCAPLSDFIKHRNDFVHGGSADERIAREISEAWRHRLEQLIEGPCRALLALAPIEILEVDFAEHETFDYTVRYLQGDDLVARSGQLTSKHRMRRGAMYLYDARLDRTLLLEPFAICELCPSCSARELFVLDRANTALDKIAFVNPTTGHVIAEASDVRRRAFERLPSFSDAARR